SLITYNGVFIKGGDQSKYYSYYKNTKTQEALQYIYNNGGALSGTSAGTALLSPIIYTAEMVSLDPAAALQNAYIPQITLADDFLNTLSERYIYDSHFIERGRFGRLSPFMAAWYKRTAEIATGIGIDDHTALCIDTSGIAKVYGTGAIGVYHNLNSTLPYDTMVPMLRAKDMKFSQLTHGCEINLKTGEIIGLNAFIQSPVAEENERVTVLLSGTDYPSDEAFNYFVNQAGSKDDTIVIVTGNDQSRANEVKLNMQKKGASHVQIIQALSSNQFDESTQAYINTANKLLFISNDYNDFMSFINGTGNGLLLSQKLKQPLMVSFFAGDNARFAGKTVVDKYSGSGFTSYHGTLEFLPGLGLLSTTAIMPNTFLNTDIYENTVSGLPYAMMSDSLSYGLYLTGNTFAAYTYSTGNKSYFINLSGSYPLIVLQNEGSDAAFANQGPYPVSRNIAGFAAMKLKFLGINDTVTVGWHVPMSINNPEKLKMKLFPNPAKDQFHILGNGGEYSIQITDTGGRIISTKQFVNNTDINLGHCPEGLYLVRVLDLKTNIFYSTKLCLIK
ncbi:MAG: T9SS type A sorting domain-containing protein, partial [Bacteroidales bacterium]